MNDVESPGRPANLVIPILLAFSAPVAVVYGIEKLHSVWWTFGLYQLSICLCFPAAISRLEGRSWREHAVLVGLQAPTVKEQFEAPPFSPRP